MRGGGVGVVEVLKLGLDNVVNKSNEDMILALAGQFKQSAHEPEKFR